MKRDPVSKAIIFKPSITKQKIKNLKATADKHDADIKFLADCINAQQETIKLLQEKK